MKASFLFALCVVAVLLYGCSSTKFSEYHGTQTIVGQVGKPRVVDGVDFWESAIPARKYQIIGIISTRRKQRVPLGPLSKAFSGSGDSDDRDSAIAKVARKHGGDGVIFVRGSADNSDSDDDFGKGIHQRRIMVVIKYLE